MLKILGVAILLFEIKILTIIHSIKKNQKHMSEKLDSIKSLVSSINDSTNNIAADLERIAGGLSGGLTAEEADSVISDLQAAATKLRAVADVNPEPTTEEQGGGEEVPPVDNGGGEQTSTEETTV